MQEMNTTRFTNTLLVLGVPLAHKIEYFREDLYEHFHRTNTQIGDIKIFRNPPSNKNSNIYKGRSDEGSYEEKYERIFEKNYRGTRIRTRDMSNRPKHKEILIEFEHPRQATRAYWAINDRYQPLRVKNSKIQASFFNLNFTPQKSHRTTHDGNFRGHRQRYPDSRHLVNKDYSPNQVLKEKYDPEKQGTRVYYNQYHGNSNAEGERPSQRSSKRNETDKRNLRRERNNNTKTERNYNYKKKWKSLPNELQEYTQIQTKKEKFGKKKEKNKKKINKEKNTQKSEKFSKNALFLIGKKENIQENIKIEIIEKHYMNKEKTLDQKGIVETNSNLKLGQTEKRDSLCCGSSNPRGEQSLSPDSNLEDSTLINELNSGVQGEDSKLDEIQGEFLKNQELKQKEKEKEKEIEKEKEKEIQWKINTINCHQLREWLSQSIRYSYFRTYETRQTAVYSKEKYHRKKYPKKAKIPKLYRNLYNFTIKEIRKNLKTTFTHSKKIMKYGNISTYEERNFGHINEVGRKNKLILKTTEEFLSVLEIFSLINNPIPLRVLRRGEKEIEIWDELFNILTYQETFLRKIRKIHQSITVSFTFKAQTFNEI
ncbi:hypothetical protein M0812_27790 [Anaeramoeba flamelloides]|uniref:Uncharacterized protein n=1 Tax=Anaeramoeba flamelloides TaxID=1746091 RepID=A0AAV7Y692_9EUKA|nr:hypothetical protein M0812_27790 [Anaeramoeba flamelloides]